MILLGSVQRIELIMMIEQHISAERRWKMATKRCIEAARYKH